MGFEHSVANMYFIPVGDADPGRRAGLVLGGDRPRAGRLRGARLGRASSANLVPVTLGNIVGGTILVGAVYWLVYLRGRH